MKIQKGDHVIVLSGNDKGKRGEVVRALPQTGHGCRRRRQPGEAPPAHDPSPQTGRHHRKGPARARLDRGIGLPQGAHPDPRRFRFADDGTKRRVCARCGEVSDVAVGKGSPGKGGKAAGKAAGKAGKGGASSRSRRPARPAPAPGGSGRSGPGRRCRRQGSARPAGGAANRHACGPST